MRSLSVLLAMCSAVLSCALLEVPQARALPNSATLRWGLDGSSEFGSAPALTLAWPMGKGLSKWVGASYLHETPSWIFVSGQARPQPYIRYIPLSVGIRASRVDDGGRPGGPFIEAGPSLAPAWYRSPGGRSGFAMMGGLQVGAGIRLGAIGSSRTEFGISYYLAEAFGEERDAIGHIGTPRKADVTLVMGYVAIGLGD